MIQLVCHLLALHLVQSVVSQECLNMTRLRSCMHTSQLHRDECPIRKLCLCIGLLQDRQLKLNIALQRDFYRAEAEEVAATWLSETVRH